MSNDLLLQIAIGIGSAGAVYGGIRADLRAMHERIKVAQESANEAHARLDRHIDKN